MSNANLAGSCRCAGTRGRRCPALGTVSHSEGGQGWARPHAALCGLGAAASQTCRFQLIWPPVAPVLGEHESPPWLWGQRVPRALPAAPGSACGLLSSAPAKAAPSCSSWVSQ